MKVLRLIEHPLLRYSLILIVGIALFFLGYYAGWYQSREELSAKAAELEMLRDKNERMVLEVKELREKIIELESRNASLSAEVRILNEELEALISKLENKSKELLEMNYTCGVYYDELTRIRDNLGKLSAAIEKLRQDRELLSILRMSPPLNRTEAKIFWNDTRTSLYRINPNLIPTVDTIIYYLDHYFNWYESLPRNATREQVCEWLLAYPTEAREYERHISKLREEVYAIMVADLGTVLGILEEVK